MASSKKSGVTSTKNVSQQTGNHWVTIGGSTVPSSRRVPSDAQLLLEYQTNPLVYACANLNANGVATTTLRLYQTKRGTLATKRKGKAVAKSEVARLRKSHRKEMYGAETVEEITDHALLTTLHEVNDQLNGNQLSWLTALYLDVVGRSYWLADLNPVTNVPDRVFVLPPQQVQPIADGSGFVVGFKYTTTVGGGIASTTYYPAANSDPKTVDERRAYLSKQGKVGEGVVIEYRFNSLSNPFAAQSPLMAAYSTVALSSNLTDYENNLITNRARPDGMLIPKGDDQGLDADGAEKFLRKWEQKFSGRGNGRLSVANGPYQYVPLSYTPMDLGSLAIEEKTFKRTCNAFGIPVGMFDKDPNRAAAEVAQIQHAQYATLPRLTLIEQQLNATFVPLYGDGSLFVAFDCPVPDDNEGENEEAKINIQKLQAATAADVPLTEDEKRALLGFEPLEGEADANATADVVAGAAGIPVGDGQEIQTTEAAVLNGAQITAALNIVSQVVAGTLPRDAGLGMLQTLFNLAEDQAASIMGSAGTAKPTTPNPSPLLDLNARVAAGDMQRAIAINLAAKLYDLEQDEARQLIGHPKEAKPTPCHCGGRTPSSKATTPTDGAKAFRVNRAAEKRLQKVLAAAFRKQEAYYLDRYGKAVEGVVTKSNPDDLPDEFVGLDEWDEELANDVKPVIEIMMDDGAGQMEARVGASPDVFSVVPAKVEAAVDKASLRFAASTNRTTTKNLNTALDMLRDELTRGLIDGDPIRELRQRVQGVFENATVERAELIAHSETQRAVHEGLRIAAKASGVVKGFKFLVSDDACPICLELEGKEIGLDEQFADNDYDDSMLPIHPGCRCSVTEILDDDADGNSDEGDDE